FSLLAIPFFVLAGEIMNAGGLSKRIVDLPMNWWGINQAGWATSACFSLLAIPFFVLAGEIMNAGGLSKRIVDLPMNW
ncbi:hypothetical protein C2U36_26965, partial [Escherichia coli]